MTIRLPNTTVQDNPSGRATWSRQVVDSLRGLVSQIGNFLPLSGGTLTGDLIVPDEAYDATAWNGSLEVPTKNAVRDKIESLGSGAVSTTGTPASGNLTKFSGASTITNGDLSGDVSTSGTLVTTIGAGKVTLAMQANMATASVVYRKTAGSGAPEVQTLATLKTDLGLTGTNSGDQTITLTGDVTGTGTGSFAATVANDAVTYAKLQNASATSRILARKTAGSGDYEECTVAEVLNFIASSAQGDVMIRDGTGWTRLGAGTSGQVLRTAGAAANPAWGRQVLRGALVRKASDQTGANYSAGAQIAWDQETYDTDSIHDNVTNNTRLTVPSGVSYVRLVGTIALANVAVDTYVIAGILKNGSSTYDGFAGQTVEIGTATTPRVNLSTPPLAVTAGDYFELRLTAEDTSVDITATQSSFAMEIIE